MNQRIDGNGNYQAGRDININPGPLFDPRNGNLMPCPACGRAVSRTADQCPDCADNLALRRQIAWEEARNIRLRNMIVGLVLVGGISYGLGQLFESIRAPATIAAVVCGIFVYGLLNNK